MFILHLLASVALFALMLGLYFLPSILAFYRTHPKRIAILLVNWLIPLGGWLIGIVLLLAAERHGRLAMDPRNTDLELRSLRHGLRPHDLSH
jgi:hypothetical protein